METKTFKVSLTINDETRQVEVRKLREGLAYTLELVAIAKVGRSGKKQWKTPVYFDEDSKGNWIACLNSTMVNKNARIIGWADKASEEKISQHNGAM